MRIQILNELFPGSSSFEFLHSDYTGYVLHLNIAVRVYEQLIVSPIYASSESTADEACRARTTGKKEGNHIF